MNFPVKKIAAKESEEESVFSWNNWFDEEIIFDERSLRRNFLPTANDKVVEQFMNSKFYTWEEFTNYNGYSNERGAYNNLICEIEKRKNQLTRTEDSSADFVSSLKKIAKIR